MHPLARAFRLATLALFAFVLVLPLAGMSCGDPSASSGQADDHDAAAYDDDDQTDDDGQDDDAAAGDDDDTAVDDDDTGFDLLVAANLTDQEFPYGNLQYNCGIYAINTSKLPDIFWEDFENCAINDLWAFDEKFIVAVGYSIFGDDLNDKGLFFARYDGDQWREVHLALYDQANDFQFRRVTGTSPTNVWAIGDSSDGYVVDRFDGNSLNRELTGDAKTRLYDVWAAKWGSVFAVGSYSKNGATNPLILEYIDGVWNEIRFDDVWHEFFAVWGISKDFIVAAGDGGMWSRGSSGWTKFDFPEPYAHYVAYEIVGTDANDFYVHVLLNDELLLHYKNGAWEAIHYPAETEPARIFDSTTRMGDLLKLSDKKLFVAYQFPNGGNGNIYSLDNGAWRKDFYDTTSCIAGFK